MRYGTVHAYQFDFTVKVCQMCDMVLMLDNKEWVVVGEKGRPEDPMHLAEIEPVPPEKPEQTRREFFARLLVPFSVLPYLQVKTEKN